MKINTQILNNAANYATGLLKNKLSENYRYHNLLHTREVVDAVTEISKGMDLYADEKNILTIAAWFHDLGYVWQQDGHEFIAAELAENSWSNRM
jgi:predicted metal-dependent HD superfamily phosphohydrolase